MHSEIKVINSKDGNCVIDIEGVIGVPEAMQFEEPGLRVATYAGFTESLRKISSITSSRVIVNIRSTGGDVNDALLIYDALTALGATVVTRCWGYVASAATIIAQAASPGLRELSENSLYLIHCSESSAEGNCTDISRTGQMLEATDLRIAEIYSRRSGLPAESFRELMNENSGRGRWLSAQEALEAGLADSIIPSTDRKRIRNESPAIMRQMVRIAGMMGLPPFPEQSMPGAADPSSGNGRVNMPSVKSMVRSLLNLFSAAAVLPRPGRVNKVYPALPKADGGSAGEDSGAAAVAKMRELQGSAVKTTVKSREDPSPTEYRRSGNELAYDNDIRNFRIG